MLLKRKRGRPPKTQNSTDDIIQRLSSQEDLLDRLDSVDQKDPSPSQVQYLQEEKSIHSIQPATPISTHVFRYTKLPEKYRRAYLETENDNNYLSLRSDIAFTVAVLTDQIANLEQTTLDDDVKTKFLSIASRAVRINPFRNPGEVVRLFKDITDLATQLGSQTNSLKEIRITQRHLIALVESERKRLEAGHNALPIEDVFTILRKSLQSVKDNAYKFIEDPHTLAEYLTAVSRDFDRDLSLVGFKNYSPAISTDIPTADQTIKPAEPFSSENQLKYSPTPLDPLDIRAEDMARVTKEAVEPLLKIEKEEFRYI